MMRYFPSIDEFYLSQFGIETPTNFFFPKLGTCQNDLKLILQFNFRTKLLVKKFERMLNIL